MPQKSALGWYNVSEFNDLNNKWTAEANIAGCQHKVELTSTLGCDDDGHGSSLVFSVKTDTGFKMPQLVVKFPGNRFEPQDHGEEGSVLANPVVNRSALQLQVWDWLHDKPDDDHLSLPASVFQQLRGKSMKHERRADGACHCYLPETELEVTHWTPEEDQESTRRQIECGQESSHGSSSYTNQGHSKEPTYADSLDLESCRTALFDEPRVSRGDNASVEPFNWTLTELVGSFLNRVGELTSDVWKDSSFQGSERTSQDNIRV